MAFEKYEIVKQTQVFAEKQQDENNRSWVICFINRSVDANSKNRVFVPSLPL